MSTGTGGSLFGSGGATSAAGGAAGSGAAASGGDASGAASAGVTPSAGAAVTPDAGAAATPDTGAAGTPAAKPAATPASEEWKAKGYEEAWLATAHGGKYKTRDALIKGTEEFGGLVRARTEEAEAAALKQAEMATKMATIEPIIGAPVNEDGTAKPYDWGFPEEATVNPVLVDAFDGLLRKHNLSEVVAKDAAGLLTEYAAAVELVNREAEIQATIDYFGGDKEKAVPQLKELEAYWRGEIGQNPDDWAAIEEVASTSAGIKALDRLRSRLTVVQNGVAATQAANETPEQVLASYAGKPDAFMSDPQAIARLTAAHERRAATR